MTSIDSYILEFVGQNWLTITLALAILREIALASPGVLDDKIVTLLGNWLGGLRPKKNGNGTEKP